MSLKISRRVKQKEGNWQASKNLLKFGEFVADVNYLIKTRI